ncbi:acyl-CoA dehydrogenase family protein [Saccharomonospora sp. NPDC046836]|uniref:acyl-CoA dehydrogenase family protein n=1 Tax=Saccharomonospora sp. NPDC046836 TaxID=3156921 RepID=UPI0033D376A3
MGERADLAGFRAEVRAFLEAELPDRLRHKVIHHHHLVPEDFLAWQRILYRRGWVAPGWPDEYGGVAWSADQRQIFDDEAAIAGAPETSPFGLRMVGPVLLKFGTDSQRARYLPRILTGEDWWCQGFSEPGAGSDLASLRLRADVTGHGFVVNGQKTWTTFAQYADMMFCLARTDPGSQAHAGISFLLVDMRSPGITVRPIRTLDGGTEINDVFFDDVVVPAGNLVGQLGEGWACARYLLSRERFGAARFGRARREFRFLRRLSTAEGPDGSRPVDDPLLAAALARLEVDLLALEEANVRLVEQDLAGAGHGAEASILKLLGTDLARRISEHLVEVAGLRALPLRPTEEPEDPHAQLARFELNLRKITIYGGADEVQRDLIARHALGLREARRAG